MELSSTAMAHDPHHDKPQGTKRVVSYVGRGNCHGQQSWAIRPTEK